MEVAGIDSRSSSTHTENEDIVWRRPFRWNGCAGWVWLAGPILSLEADTPTTTDADLDLRRRDSAESREKPLLWLAAHHCRTGEAHLPCQSQAAYRISEDNLLCLRRRKFVVVTTNSNHTRPIYPNLARGMALTSEPNQLWRPISLTSAGVGVRLASAVILGMFFHDAYWLGARP